MSAHERAKQREEGIVFECTHESVSRCAYIYRYIDIHIYIYVYIYMYICIYICIYIYIHIHIYLYLYMLLDTHVSCSPEIVMHRGTMTTMHIAYTPVHTQHLD